MSSRQIGVGIVGYGGAAKYYHLPFIIAANEFKLEAFLQRAPAPSSDSKTPSGVHCSVDYPEVNHFQRYEDFLANKSIELVVICTHIESHANLARQAMQAGKHVVVEKPIALTSAEADELIGLAQQKGTIFSVYQNRRYDSDFRTIEKLVEAGALGKIVEFENRFDHDKLEPLPWDNPNPGDGMTFVLGAHTIDQTIRLFGRPKYVTSFERSLRERCKTDDSSTIILEFEGENEHVICTLKASVVSRGPSDRRLKFIVRGTEGSFIKTGEDQQFDHVVARIPPNDLRFGEESSKFHGYLFSTAAQPLDQYFEVPSCATYDGTLKSLKGSYTDFYRDLASALRGEKQLMVTPEEARDVLRVIELAKQSAASGKTMSWT